MSTQPKPQARLTPSLLARKGDARPAMRPQGFVGLRASAESADDLGWDDQGTMPPVLIEREALSTAFSVRQSVSSPDAAPAKPARTAFTLRLDEDRHLKLRLASALRNQSAQQLVVEALDIFLGTLPDITKWSAIMSTSDETVENWGLIR
jgi:hypothetical protein